MKNNRIESLKAREVLNNKGQPVLEVDVVAGDGRVGRASASSGVSAGSHEAFILTDGGARFGGMGVLKAIAVVDEVIGPALIGRDPCDQRTIDTVMLDLDGTPDKSKLGGNTICSVSMAVARLGADVAGLPLYRHLGGEDRTRLPVPMFNPLNGGPFSTSPADFQEFQLTPVGAPSFAEAMRMGVEVFLHLPEVIRKRHGAEALKPGHLAGYGAPSAEPGAVVETLLAAVGEAGYEGRFLVSFDCAASHLFDAASGTYRMAFGHMDTDGLIAYLDDLSRAYPVFLLEDPLDENDFEGFARLNARTDAMVCGDDLFVNDLERLKKGVELDAAGAMIFKPNMIGSVTEALDAATFATANGIEVIPSLRAQTAENDPIASLAVATGARLMKVGAPQSGERTRQQNALLRIEEDLGGGAAILSADVMRQWMAKP
jgi:enolase